MKKLIEGLPFYQDKLHEETVFNRFNDILVKVRLFFQESFALTHESLAQARSNKSANKPDLELKEFERVNTGRASSTCSAPLITFTDLDGTQRAG